MLKTSSLAAIKTFSSTSNFSLTNLLDPLTKKRASFLDKMLPTWSNKKIENKLFTPRTRDPRSFRLPRGFKEEVMETPDGKISVYQTGRGPTVLLIHGWDGGAHQFFPIMRGLAQCGFNAMAFDQLGHGKSERKPATLQQSIDTTNHVLNHLKRKDGCCAIVGHSTGCIAIANARPALLKDVALFLISPVFNYKLYFLKKLVRLEMPNELIKQYAAQFAKIYKRDYQRFELARHLDKYGDTTVIAHDATDTVSSLMDSEKFVARYPLTKLLVTKKYDHTRLINSESVWQELKSHLNYDDTTINFTAEVIYE